MWRAGGAVFGVEADESAAPMRVVVFRAAQSTVDRSYSFIHHTCSRSASSRLSGFGQNASPSMYWDS
jgi:hypothetical protein